MNTSRRISLLVLLVSTLTAGLWAQRVTPTIVADNQLVELLELTPEQVAEIEALETETETKMAAHREAGKAARQEARATRQDHSRALNDILTEQQQEQLRSYRMKQRTDRREALQAVDWESMRAELKAYRENTIEPTLRTQRAKLDHKLSKEDRTAVVALQEELAAVRAEQRQAQQVVIVEETEAPAAAPAKPGRRMRRQTRGAAGAPLDIDSRDAAAELAAKYATHINGLFAEIAPQREQWKADQEAIRAKYLPERPNKPGQKVDVGEEKIEQRNISFLLMKSEQ
jgi:hypothetical protein